MTLDFFDDTIYFLPLLVTCQPINNINPMWSGNGPIKTIDSPGYAEALRMAQAEDETLGIRNIYGTRSSKEITVVESMTLFANFYRLNQEKNCIKNNFD